MNELVVNLDNQMIVHNKYIVELSDSKGNIKKQAILYNSADASAFLQGGYIDRLVLDVSGCTIHPIGTQESYSTGNNSVPIDSQESGFFWKRNEEATIKTVKATGNDGEIRILKPFWSSYRLDAKFTMYREDNNDIHFSGISLYQGNNQVSKAELKDIEGDNYTWISSAKDGNIDMSVHIFIYFGVNIGQKNNGCASNSQFQDVKNYICYPISLFQPKSSALCGYCSYLEYEEKKVLGAYGNNIPVAFPFPHKTNFGLTSSLIPEKITINGTKVIPCSISNYVSVGEPNINNSTIYCNKKISYLGLITGLVIPGIGVINLLEKGIGAAAKDLISAKDRKVVGVEIPKSTNCLFSGSLVPASLFQGKICYIPREYTKTSSAKLMTMKESAFYNAEEIVLKRKRKLDNSLLNDEEVTEINIESFPGDSITISKDTDKRRIRCLGGSQHIPMTNLYGAGISTLPCAQGNDIMANNSERIDIIYSSWKPLKTDAKKISKYIMYPRKAMVGCMYKRLSVDGNYTYSKPSIILEGSYDGNHFEIIYDSDDPNINSENRVKMFEPYNINLQKEGYPFYRLRSRDSGVGTLSQKTCGNKQVAQAMWEYGSNNPVPATLLRPVSDADSEAEKMKARTYRDMVFETSINNSSFNFQSAANISYDPYYIFMWDSNTYKDMLTKIKNESELSTLNLGENNHYLVTKVPYLYKITDKFYFTGKK